MTKDREIIDILNIAELQGLTLNQPARLIFHNPRRGSPMKLAEIRPLLAPLGKVRYSGTQAKIFVDVDPGEPEKPLIALDMIARNDAAGLERAILSALSQVDEIVIGIDGRSDEETRKVAEAYADIVHVFQATDIGLPEEDWKADKIHFGNARNLGRAKVKAPWTLVLDTDEYILETEDLREAIAQAKDAVVSLQPEVTFGSIQQHDPHRLTFTCFPWAAAIHNTMEIEGEIKDINMVIMHDNATRTAEETGRRDMQRREAVETLREEADKGNLHALYHLAKQKVGGELLEEALPLVTTFRFKAEVHGALAAERAILAIGLAMLYYNRDNFIEAELWCHRAMLDGPRVDVMCFLGDLAEERGEIQNALAWYEAACVLPEMKMEKSLGLTSVVDMRFGRRSGIRHALGLT